jgi:hypothetical protein
MLRARHGVRPGEVRLSAVQSSSLIVVMAVVHHSVIHLSMNQMFTDSIQEQVLGYKR